MQLYPSNSWVVSPDFTFTPWHEHCFTEMKQCFINVPGKQTLGNHRQSEYSSEAQDWKNVDPRLPSWKPGELVVGSLRLQMFVVGHWLSFPEGVLRCMQDWQASPNGSGWGSLFFVHRHFLCHCLQSCFSSPLWAHITMAWDSHAPLFQVMVLLGGGGVVVVQFLTLFSWRIIAHVLVFQVCRPSYFQPPI